LCYCYHSIFIVH